MKSQNPPPADKISCPKCGMLIPVTDTLQQQLSERVRLDLEKRIEQEKNRIEQEAKQKAQEGIALELEDLQHQVEERDEKLRIAQEGELSLRRRERELEDRASSVERELVRRVDEEKEKLEQEALRKAEQAVSVELQDLHTQIRERNEIIEAAHQTELELRKRERDLEGKATTLELEVLRRVHEARSQIEEETATLIIQEHRLRDAEKDRQLDDMRRQIEELRRRAEQGSRQMQGEIREHELEELLRTNFPLDDIRPVPRGVRGADILQYISTRAGTRCGSIIWESKKQT